MKTNKKSFTKGKITKGKITKGKIKKVFNNYEIKKILNKRLEKDFSAWKNIDKSNFQEIIEKFYIENRNRHKILKIEIKNNKVTADMEYLKKYKLFLLRGEIIYNMFKFILSKINIKIPYLVLYVSLGDEIVSQELPILGFALKLCLGNSVSPPVKLSFKYIINVAYRKLPNLSVSFLHISSDGSHAS